MNNSYIISSLTNILNTYQSIVAYFYQRITQTQYTNNQLATYTIDYFLLLPSSQYILSLNPSQVSAQVQAYIDLCNVLITYITTNVNFQTNLFYEQIQNQLNTSITQLNGFAESLLTSAYANLYSYKIPYNMSMATALYLNGINLDTYALQANLNYNLADFNNLQQNSTITLSRG